jgi:dCMP deaminase
MKDRKVFIKNILHTIQQQSECRSRSVGAIIVIEGRIISEGWNSPPKKCSELDCIRCNNKIPSGQQLETALCVHAEINAICSAARLGIALKNASLYCTTKPCSECAKAISAAGIIKVFYIEDYHSLYTDLIFKNANIICEIL